ncbi:hypothetical protein ACFQ15_17975 [Sphingomonas hankookensis]|uniref:hypothetical protein n=1 Tax=Sphingomonas hankookensis TaxID=563996 RepID=UPI001F57D4AC|nr:hypothetical protein [Sphingomonas hankookensis]
MTKNKRPTIPRTASEIGNFLNDTLDSLVAACDRFDNKDTREYRHIAVLIRSLCRDTRTSHSLLSQANMKDRNFLSSNLVIYPGNMFSTCNLVELVLQPKVPEKPATWRAVLDAGAMVFEPFEDWWRSSIIVRSNGEKFSRSDIVGYVADQDGGAHVDPEIDAAFESMRRDAFNFTSAKSITDNIDRYVIRQIAHEMLKSMRPSYRRLNSDRRNQSIYMIPYMAQDVLPEEVVIIGYQETNPASKCPCGSGLRFLECHKKGVIAPRDLHKWERGFPIPEGADGVQLAFKLKQHG